MEITPHSAGSNEMQIFAVNQINLCIFILYFAIDTLKSYVYSVI
jgi:hypothetical protein